MGGYGAFYKNGRREGREETGEIEKGRNVIATYLIDGMERMSGEFRVLCLFAME